MLSRQPLWIAVLVLVAFILAPITVTFTLVHAMPDVPADAELVNQSVYGMCNSGPLLKYVYKKGDTVWMVYKASNKPAAMLLIYKLNPDESGTLLEIYDRTDKLTHPEALARYPSACAMIEART